MQIVEENLEVCQDCAMFIANGELPEDPNLAQMIVEGNEKVVPNYFVLTFDNDIDFSRKPCNCCGDQLHGSRHQAVLLGK